MHVVQINSVGSAEKIVLGMFSVALFDITIYYNNDSKDKIYNIYNNRY